MTTPDSVQQPGGWRERLHEVIFEADTPAGKAFDVALLVAILISVVVTSLQTVEEGYGKDYGDRLDRIERTLTILFTAEYVLRIVCVRRASGYIFSFFGIVDLLAILPGYLGGDAARLAVIRSLRLLRVFRVFKLGWFVSEADALREAVWQSRAKIIVFVFTVVIMVTLAGTLMYLVERDAVGGGPQIESIADGEDGGPQIKSIPDGIYWAIVTMTTVGYGDLVPVTLPGKIVSAVLILIGYSLIIVPTGFVSAELVQSAQQISTRRCPHCMAEGHARDAIFCNKCGRKL